MSTAVITGAGVVTAFGVGLEALFDGLGAGRCAVTAIESFDARGFPARVAGEVKGELTGSDWLGRWLDCDRAAIARWERCGLLRDRKVPLGLVAAAEAWRRASCGPSDSSASLSIALGMERIFLDDLVGLLAPPGSSQPAGIELGERSVWAEAAAATRAVRYRSAFDDCARLVREMLALQGSFAVHASACAGGALAVAHAAALVRRGTCDIVLAGAADSMLNPMGLGGLCRLGVPSPRNEPDACRPFDARRDGLVVGEGAAMFVVESEARALARGVVPLARILGWGSSHDGYRLSAPRPDGAAAARAITMALERAELAPAQVGYVNAHGTATQLNDRAEACALHHAIGERAATVPVSSIKGAIGHLMAASGAVELAACLLPFARDVLPATAHYAEPDPECNLAVVGPEPVEARIDTVLSNSFGFGGQNAAVVLGRWP